MYYMKNKAHLLEIILLASIIIISGRTIHAQVLFTKPAWLPQLSLGVTQGYDNNLFGVSGNGLQPQGSWYTIVSPGIGFDFAPLLGSQAPFQTLLLNYTPDFATYEQASTEDYQAHRFGTDIKGGAGDFSFLLTNSFLYNDGSKIAPTYAFNQIATGTEANQFDKYRNQFANTPARERRNQIQDREASSFQYDVGSVFIRATSSLLLYDMNTDFHNTKNAPYLGYQNYPSRYDVNGGGDLGYKVATNLALTLGYRYGAQYQQQFSKEISPTDSHYSSSTYQRVLFGLEGKPFHWLTATLDGGPDFRSYNPNTPVYDLHPTKYYAEAALEAALSARQSLTFAYKQWNWVSSSGYVPEFDSSYDLKYHRSETRQLGFDLRLALLEADYTSGYDTIGTAPSIRSDREYIVSPDITYAFTPQLSTIFSYSFNAGNNELYTIPASSHPAYKNFIDQVVSVGLMYKF
jgi:hypothetical protein